MTNADLIKHVINLEADYILCWVSNGRPSPRVWGKRSGLREPSRSSRTIPTRVGKTPTFKGISCSIAQKIGAFDF